MFHQISIDNAYKIASSINHLKFIAKDDYHLSVVNEIEQLLFSNSQMSYNKPESNNEARQARDKLTSYQENVSKPIEETLFQELRDWDDNGDYIEPSTEDKLNNLDYRLQNFTKNFVNSHKAINQNLNDLPQMRDYIEIKDRLRNIEDYLESRQNHQVKNVSLSIPPAINERYNYTFHVTEQVVDINDKQLRESFTVPLATLCAIIDEIKDMRR